MLGAVNVETCESCGGALGPGSDFPPCLCQLEPVAKAAGVPEPKGTAAEAQALKCPSCGAFLDTGARRCRFCKVELASVRCWCCFALAFAGTSHCARCGSRLGLEGDLGPTERRCPGCDGDVLHVIDVGSYRVEECPECTGVLLDHATLEHITRARESEAGVRLRHGPKKASLSVGQPVVYRKCPECHKIMNRQNFGRTSGVIIDVCSDHGVWFDPEELTQILEFVSTGGLAQQRERDLMDAKAELSKRRIEALGMQHKAVQLDSHTGCASSGALISALGGFDW